MLRHKCQSFSLVTGGWKGRYTMNVASIRHFGRCEPEFSQIFRGGAAPYMGNCGAGGRTRARAWKCARGGSHYRVRGQPALLPG